MMASQIGESIHIFYLYAPEDGKWARELEKHLSRCKNREQIIFLPGSTINAGWDRRGLLRQYIEQAHVILLFVSPDFLASDDCNNFAVNLAMQKYKSGKCRLIPLIIRPVQWQDEPFAILKVLPDNARPVTKWSDRDEALTEIAAGIQEAIQDILQDLSFSTLVEEQVQQQQTTLLKDTSVVDEQITSLIEPDQISSVSIQKPKYTSLSQSSDIAISNESTTSGTLTVQDILGFWQDITDFLKQRNLTLVAHLASFRVVCIEGPAIRPTIILQTQEITSYQYMQETIHLMDLELALAIALKRQCSVCLVEPQKYVVV
jgi:hypothetical protein